MDWDALRADIHLSTHFLDNIIDVNKYPLPEIDALSKRIRRIGLGVMGFADALIRLGIAYDTPEGVEFGRKVMEFLDVEGKRESERLANERAGARKSMVGSGDRSERIRTYNFPQGRITDHRINLTKHNLTEVLEGPGLTEIIDALVAEDEAERLAGLEEA